MDKKKDEQPEERGWDAMQLNKKIGEKQDEMGRSHGKGQFMYYLSPRSLGKVRQLTWGRTVPLMRTTNCTPLNYISMSSMCSHCVQLCVLPTGKLFPQNKQPS